MIKFKKKKVIATPTADWHPREMSRAPQFNWTDQENNRDFILYIVSSLISLSGYTTVSITHDAFLNQF